MSDQLFDAEVVEKVSKKPPPREDWFVVVGYCISQHRWVLRKDTWQTARQAGDAAARLPLTWSDYEIIRIPGHAH